MTLRSRYKVVLVLLICCLGGALKGFLMVKSEGANGTSMIPGSIVLFGSVVLGLVASLFRFYLKPHKDDVKSQDQIAVETLAELGRKQALEREARLRQKDK